MPLPLSYPDYLDIRASLDGARPDQSAAGDLFSGLLAYVATPAHVSRKGTLAERVWIHEVSGNYFDVLGVRPALGRVFRPGEGENRGADPIVVLAHRYWLERFHGDPAILGDTLEVNGTLVTIVGVAHEDFGGAEVMTRASLFVPATMADQLHPERAGALAARGNATYMVMGRLRPGASVEQAQAAADAILQRLIAEYPDDHTPAHAVIVPEARSRPSPMVSGFTPVALGALTVLAILVLAVAVANVANLLFARAADAERAIAIRSSLGATRWRLIRELLAESVLLALAAAVVGAYASEGLGHLLQRITASSDVPPPAEYAIGWGPFAFTLAAALVTGVATGWLPAWRATRLDVLPLLKDSMPAAARARHPLRSLLVVGQIALTCIVLVCAGLSVRSVQVLSNADLGFRPENVLLASFDLELQRYDKDRSRTFHERLLREVRALPGVDHASLARTAPFDAASGLRGGISAEGQPDPDRDQTYLIATVPVEAAYLETMGIPLLEGRHLTEHDDEDGPQVAIVSRAVAEHFWPAEDPIGKRLDFGGNRLVEVVGLVGQVRHFMMTDQDRPLIFLPLAQHFTSNVSLVVRAPQAPALSRPIRQIVHRLDPGLPADRIRTLEEHIASSPLGLMPLRIGAMIAGTQGALVLLLVLMGVYGLVSFAVARRTREIGVRRALGATARDVLVLVTRRSLVLIIIGLTIGLLLAAGVTVPLAGLLYGIAPHDATVFGGVTLLLTAVSLLAAWLPARRASRISPLEALRIE